MKHLTLNIICNNMLRFGIFNIFCTSVNQFLLQKDYLSVNLVSALLGNHFNTS